MYLETKIPDTMYNKDVVHLQQGMGRESECWKASCCVVKQEREQENEYSAACTVLSGYYV
jgi:hypothetical protein